jgi:hypothetical protein
MSNCAGSPAETYALPYIEGALSEFEAARFEEHYFDCPVCLAYVQTLEALQRELKKNPVAEPAAVHERRILAWPGRAWALGAAAAALLAVAFLTYKVVMHRPVQPAIAHTTPSAAPPSPQPSPATPTPRSPAVAPSAPPARIPAIVKPSQLADLALPAFTAATLRGESVDPAFQRGMAAYAHGDCNNALSELTGVADASRELLAAQFYSGLCQMHLKDFAAASATLGAVTDHGDSPQQEAAYYYLAQAALAQDDAGAAHGLLQHTMELHGDFEARARAQDRKILDLLAQSAKAAAARPRS